MIVVVRKDGINISLGPFDQSLDVGRDSLDL